MDKYNTNTVFRLCWRNGGILGSWRMKHLLPLLLLTSSLHAQDLQEGKQVLDVVHNFFYALEKQDTVAFNRMFLEGARNFYVRDLKDSVVVRGMLVKDFRFRPGQVLRERMRESITEVKIHKNIAMVWAPYDLWVNDEFSHCGVDVFTLIKDPVGWRIASVSYTVEREGCD